MKSLRYVCLALAASAICAFSWLSMLPSHAAQPTVQMHTEPPLHLVTPNGAPIRIALQAVDVKGKALSNARLQLQLLTPVKTPWFTSDFPIVEGTTLLKLNAEAPSGKVEFEQTLPIRGRYALKAQVAPLVAGAFEPFEQSLDLSVPENSVKYRNAAILIGILLAAGFAGGWIIGGDHATQVDEVAPQPVRSLLSGAIVLAIVVLLIVNISAELHPAHHHGEITLAPKASVQRSKSLEIRLSGDQHATVGQLASQTVQVINLKTGQPEPKLAIKTTTVSLENNQPMFAYQGNTDSKGQLTWQAQFFDGAPHRVTAQVSALNEGTLQASHDVEVDAIAPPLFIRLISLGYYTSAFVVSLLIGLWAHRRVARKTTAFGH